MRRAYYILTFFIMLAIVAVLLTCNNGERDKLSVADRMFDIKTDSAAILLKEIDTTRLSETDKALWHLLNVRYHYYMNNPDYPDALSKRDEQLLIKRNLPSELQELYFWKSKFQMDRGELINAIISLDKSNHYLDISNGDILITHKLAIRGHIYKELATAWKMLGDKSTAVYYNDACIGLYSTLDYDMNAYKYALLDKVSLYESFDNYEDALNTLDTVHLRYDNNFRLSCKVLSLYPLIGIGAVDSVTSVLNELRKTGINNQYVYFAEAWIALQNEDYETARGHINKIRSNPYFHYGDTYKPVRHIEFEKKLEESAGNLHAALLLGDTIISLNNDTASQKNRLMARNAIDHYRTQQKELLQNETRSTRIILILIIILSVVAVAGLVVAGVILIRRHQHQADGLLSQINNLRISDEAHRKSIHSLVQSRFEILNRLCDDYLELSELKDQTAVKNEIYRNVNAQLLEMRGSRFKNKLAESVNTDLEGLIDRFRSVGGITRDEDDLFLYLAAGFSVKAVGVFLELKKSSVYTRRRRLREKLEQSDSQYKEELLNYL